MDRKQFDKLVDYSKLKSNTSVINEAKYQLFRDENDPFIDVLTIDDELVRKNRVKEESVDAKDAKPLVMLTNSQSDICFGRLLREMRASSGQVNRMWYRVNVFDPSITDAMAQRWMRIGKGSKIIPDHFEVSYVTREKPTSEHYALSVINNVQDLSPPIFYLGASFLRCLREKPAAVVGGIHLMHEIELDPYVAFVFLHKYCIAIQGHMPLDVTVPYGEKVSKSAVEEIKVDVGLIIGLRKLIFSHKHKTRMIGSTSFNCAETISSLRPPKMARIYVNIYETMEPGFMNILECEPGSTKESKAIQSYVEKKGNSNAR